MVMMLSLVSVSSATLLKFHLDGRKEFPTQHFSHIHFKAGGNNFGGLIARDVSQD
jgi:hypothetical protein